MNGSDERELMYSIKIFVCEIPERVRDEKITGSNDSVTEEIGEEVFLGRWTIIPILWGTGWITSGSWTSKTKKKC